MILSCPSCSARFRVDADQLGVAGRKVRCAKCGHVWHATPEQDESGESGGAAAGASGDGGAELAGTAADEAAADDDLPDEPPPFESFEAMREQMAGERRARARARAAGGPPAKPRARWRAVLGWLVLLAAVGGILGGAWYARYSIVGTFPTAARLYDMAGIPINTVAPGLRIQDVRPSRRLEDGTSVLVLTGRVINDTESTQPVPALRVSLKGADGTVLETWRIAANSAAVPPGGSTAFKAEKTDPPDGATEITVRFIRPGV